MNSYSKEIRENAKAELDVAKMEAKTEKIRANASQKILEKGARKEKYNNLLRFEFSSDPAEHEHQLLQLCGDFLNCYDEKGGAKLYKAYNSLLEKDLTILMASNIDLYNKINPLFEKAKVKGFKKIKRFWFIAGGIWLVSSILITIAYAGTGSLEFASALGSGFLLSTMYVGIPVAIVWKVRKGSI